MSDKNHKNGSRCFSEVELVSYLYGESREPEQAAFEQHLSGCTACTDEFANLSDSRFSVYRWRKTEFAHLTTPVIAGPWQKPAARAAQATETKESRSWLDGLLAAFRRPAFALTLVPALILVAVVMSVYLSRTQDANTGVADNKQLPAVQDAPGTAIQPQPGQLAELTPSREKRPAIASEKDRKNTTVAYTNAVKTPSARQMIRREEASTNIKRDSLTATRRAPRLSDFEDEDDGSVRLVDLLAEAETDRDKDR